MKTLRNSLERLPVRRFGVTDLLALGWVFASIYRSLCSRPLETGRETFLWPAALLSVLVAWAVLERLRWGRLAMLGIALATVVDALFAVYLISLASGPLSSQPAPLIHSLDVLSAYSCGPVFGAILLAISVTTITHLLTAPARIDFEFRKRATTTWTQFGIAASLLALWVFVQIPSGLAHAVMTSIVQASSGLATRQAESLGTAPVLRLSRP